MWLISHLFMVIARVVGFKKLVFVKFLPHFCCRRFVNFLCLQTLFQKDFLEFKCSETSSVSRSGPFFLFVVGERAYPVLTSVIENYLSRLL